MPGTKRRGLLYNRKNGFDIFNYIFMAVFALITIFPIYYVLIVSFATQSDIQKHLIYILPYSIDFRAYALVFKEKTFYNAFLISVIITSAGTFLSMLTSTAAAFVLSKKHVPGGKIMFAIILIPLFFSGGLIPFYMTMRTLHLVNNILVLVLPALMNTFYLILLKNFFEDIPASIEESAKIDGANDLHVLYKIVLPMSAPVIATISLFYAVEKWNDYFTALMFISSKNLKPLQLVLREVLLDFQQIMGSSIGQAIASNSGKAVYTKSLQMAIIVVSTVPIFIIYPFLQKHFTKGLNMGAVKE